MNLDHLEGVELPPASLRLERSVWGLDCSTHIIALAAIKPYRPGRENPLFDVGSYPVAKLDGGPRRLNALRGGFTDWLEAWASEWPPCCVVIEQPFGAAQHVHPQSFYVLGVVQACLAAALPADTPITLMGPPVWKKTALGTGNGMAKKPQIMDWARAQGFRGHSQDEADALAIATAAGVTWEAVRAFAAAA